MMATAFGVHAFFSSCSLFRETRLVSPKTSIGSGHTVHIIPLHHGETTLHFLFDRISTANQAATYGHIPYISYRQLADRHHLTSHILVFLFQETGTEGSGTWEIGCRAKRLLRGDERPSWTTYAYESGSASARFLYLFDFMGWGGSSPLHYISPEERLVMY